MLLSQITNNPLRITKFPWKHRSLISQYSNIWTIVIKWHAQKSAGSSLNGSGTLCVCACVLMSWDWSSCTNQSASLFSLLSLSVPTTSSCMSYFMLCLKHGTFMAVWSTKYIKSSQYLQRCLFHSHFIQSSWASTRLYGIKPWSNMMHGSYVTNC